MGFRAIYLSSNPHDVYLLTLYKMLSRRIDGTNLSVRSYWPKSLHILSSLGQASAWFVRPYIACPGLHLLCFDGLFLLSKFLDQVMQHLVMLSRKLITRPDRMDQGTPGGPVRSILAADGCVGG